MTDLSISFAIPADQARWPACSRRIVGLMSGTSLDGVDAVLIEITGGIPPEHWQVCAFVTRPYTSSERERIAALLRDKISLPALVTANMWLGELFAEAALAVIHAAGFTPDEVDAIASHGQTVWHIPPHDHASGGTLQIGEPCVIAERTGILTVADFRPRDMAAGGQGAPLVPFADYLLFRNETQSMAILNIGGIANVTYLPCACQPGDVVAFDTGPGNMIIDALVTRATGGLLTYDRDGAIAASAKVSQPLLTELCRHPYFAECPPKSTGRETFGEGYADALWHSDTSISHEELIATVTAFTAESIAGAVRRFLLSRGPLDRIILGGGGAFNPTLTQMLRERLPEVPLVTLEDIGISSDAKEAMAFALLGHATLCGVPNNMPSATGAEHPVILGKIIPGRMG